MNKQKLCFVTAARSEYGLLKWLMNAMRGSEIFEMQIVVTGSHLLYDQGHTVDEIREDGFCITETVSVNFDLSSKAGIASSMGKMGESFTHVFEKLKPDYLLVLGDRYELMPICSTAFVMGIPIIHISGGDETKGAIDDGIRNAVTMLASYHFPGTVTAAKNIERMTSSSKNIWAVGELGLDAFHHINLMSRQELAENIGLNENSQWILMTYHAETKQDLEYNMAAACNCVEILNELNDYQVLITYANADFFGTQINTYFQHWAEKKPKQFKMIPSLGQKRYLSYMKQVSFVIGNSSSGIVEAPYLEIPVVNVGNRQEGRYLCNNIVQSGIQKAEIRQAVQTALHRKINRDDLKYWGDGHASERIKGTLEKIAVSEMQV